MLFRSAESRSELSAQYQSTRSSHKHRNMIMDGATGPVDESESSKVDAVEQEAVAGDADVEVVQSTTSSSSSKKAKGSRKRPAPEAVEVEVVRLRLAHLTLCTLIQGMLRSLTAMSSRTPMTAAITVRLFWFYKLESHLYEN